MIDKRYCMSSYLAYRYIADDNRDFSPVFHHENYQLLPEEARTAVRSAADMDRVLEEQFQTVRKEKPGLLLSGGMDSAILASYLPGGDAYTFRFQGGAFQPEEQARAAFFARKNGMRLHYVDITWETTEPLLDGLMRHKGAPVHSIEPQIARAALQAREDGIERMVIGDAADYIFGGMDRLLSQDWTYAAFQRRYWYLDPAAVLREAAEVDGIMRPYRRGDGIDFVSFMEKYAAIESYGSYDNAFRTVSMPCLDPYEVMKLAEPLDLARIRAGESKYLVRDLFRLKYPDVPIPEKNPMPRPVDRYFQDWRGPVRPEFLPLADRMGQFSGNQKWLLYCLERFLNLSDREDREQGDVPGACQKQKGPTL